MENNNICLKKINNDDLELLRKWRMQENVSKYMLTDPIITKESQKAWYDNIKMDTSRLDYIIVFNDVKIGYYGITNIDNNNSSCEIGFYIGESEYRGKGIFKVIQDKIEDIIFNNLKINKIIIKVLEYNPILSVYIKNGFIEDDNFKSKVIKSNKEFAVLFLYKIKE